MFFFFIGGIQPKTIDLEEGSRICPICGLSRAKLRRVDHYLSLFFIPLFPVKKGEPVLICDRCGVVGDDTYYRSPSDYLKVTKKDLICQYCGKSIAPDFRYCPFCGRPV